MAAISTCSRRRNEIFGGGNRRLVAGSMDISKQIKITTEPKLLPFFEKIVNDEPIAIYMSL